MRSPSLSSYEAHSGRGELSRAGCTLVVDFALASQGQQLGSLPLLSKVMVIGGLELQGENVSEERDREMWAKLMPSLLLSNRPLWSPFK